MSVIIRGMKMPKDCHECMIRADCPVGTQRFIVTGRPRGCLLVEISTPHGRLIDIKSVEDGMFATVGNDYQRWWNGALESVIDNAPTVIEAEGET